jgi:hypothetical protein
LRQNPAPAKPVPTPVPSNVRNVMPPRILPVLPSVAIGEERGERREERGEIR